MRTTLDLDEDVLFAAKELSKLTNRTMGQTVSDLARASLVAGSSPALKVRDVSSDSQKEQAPSTADILSIAEQKRRAWLSRFGVIPLPRREGPLVTNEWVNRIRDEEGI
jgi:hypothetical protein